MVVDTLANAAKYAELHPGFPRAFAFLAATDLAALPPGRHTIDGDRMYVSIDHKDGRGREGARLEAHRRYIDIQVTIDGREEIGWAPLGACRSPADPFDEIRDVRFYEDRPQSWIALPPGHFAIFFPDDAHAPLAGKGLLTKAIVKVAVRPQS